jgi:hypothetical protein
MLQGLRETHGLGQVSDGALTGIRREPVLSDADLAQFIKGIGRRDRHLARVAALSGARVGHLDTDHAERPQCGQEQGVVGRLESVFRLRFCCWHGRVLVAVTRAAGPDPAPSA